MIRKDAGEEGADLVSAKGRLYADDPHRLRAKALTVKAPFGNVPRS